MIWPLALVVGGLVALLAAECGNYRGGILAAKVTTGAGLVSLATTQGASAWVLAAAILFAVGDLLLSSKFSAGFGAFLLGYLALAVAFAQQGIVGFSAVLALLLMLLISHRFSKWLLPRLHPQVRMPATAYMMALSLMTAFAYGAWRGDMHWAVMVGALALAGYETTAARNRVAPTFENKLWGLPLFYGGQAVLILSFAQA